MRISFAFALAVTLLPKVVLAQDADATKPTEAPAAPPEPRTFLWNEEPRLPGSLKVVAMSSATYASNNKDAQGFASNVAMPGASVQIGAEVGLVSERLSIEAAAFEGGTFDTFGALAGVRLALFPTAWSTHAVLSGGYIKELYSGNGAWGRLALSQDIGRVRLVTTIHGQHVFADGRDAIDMMVMLGANVRLASIVRLGVEYVAQDIEAAFDPEEAEGGMRHFLGPTASLSLLRDRLTIGAGPAAGLSETSPRLVGRFTLAYAF